MRIGYARVSTHEQSTDLQMDALRLAGCEQIEKEVAGGARRRKRPVLDAVIRSLRAGDVLIVWKLDRLGRSMRDLAKMFEKFDHEGILFQSLTEQIDSSRPMGKAMLALCGVFAELEHSLISERTNAGLDAAKARGRAGGRPKKITDPETLKQVRLLYADPDLTIADACSSLAISRATFYRYLDGSKQAA